MVGNVWQDFADFSSALNAGILHPSLQTAEFNQILEKDVVKSQTAFQLYRLATERLKVVPDQRTFDLVLAKLATEGQVLAFPIIMMCLPHCLMFLQAMGPVFLCIWGNALSWALSL